MSDETQAPVATFGGHATPAQEAAAEREPRAVAAIDSSVQQGNRVTTAQAVKPATPLHDLTEKVNAHYNALMGVLGDVRAAANEMESLANRLKSGN